MSWKPIETAPRDGTSILTTDGRDCFVAWFQYGDWCIAWHEYDGPIAFSNDYFTHWMPLPQPPEGSQE